MVPNYTHKWFLLIKSFQTELIESKSKRSVSESYIPACAEGGGRLTDIMTCLGLVLQKAKPRRLAAQEKARKQVVYLNTSFSKPQVLGWRKWLINANMHSAILYS